MKNRFGFFDGKEEPKQSETTEFNPVRTGGSFGEDLPEDEGLLPSEQRVKLPEDPSVQEKIAATTEREVSLDDLDDENDDPETMAAELGEVVAQNDDVEGGEVAQMAAEMDMVASAEPARNSAAMIEQIPEGNLITSMFGRAAVAALNAEQGYPPIGEKEENE